MKTRILAALVCLSLLPGCGLSFGLSVDELMQAPRLNQQQQEMYNALEATLNLSDIVYKYPQSGDYRSPYVFYDLTGDGIQEAIVFYAYAAEASEVRAMILRQDGRGGWSMVDEIGDLGSQIDFVRFAHVTSRDYESMILGWQGTRYSMLDVYALKEGRLQMETRQTYSRYLMEDFNRDGLMDIAAVYQDLDNRFQLALLQTIDGHIVLADQLPLSVDATGVLQILGGTLWNGRRGLYVDQAILGGAATATEVFQVHSSTLSMVAGDDPGDDALMDNYVMTFREEPVLSTVLGDEGDTQVVVPQLALLPGQDQSAEIQPLYLIQYMGLTDQGFLMERAAVVNETDGYRLYFPESWIDLVTVVRQPENSEWRFYAIDPDTDQPSTELLRIRRYSVNDYRDHFVTQDYILLAERGLSQYYAYLPGSGGNPMGISRSTLESLFELL